MKYNELQPTLQNLTNKKISISQIGEVLGFSRQNMHKKVSDTKKEVSEEEIELLEKFFDVVLIGAYIKADYYVEVLGSCGNGAFIFSEQKEIIEVPTNLITNFSKHKKYAIINAVGDSMMPTINNKDRLIVEHCENEQIKDNQVYVFCYNNEIYVKRLVKNIDEIIIKSDNPDPVYRPRIIEKDDMNNIYVIGEIVGLMRNLK